MHLLVRETRALDEDEPAVDLGHAPADLVLLSFSDSDLAAAAAGWQAMGVPKPTLRLANLARLRHPMSVDLYLERVVAKARAVVVRLLGGLDYWRYGAEETAALCRARGIALAVLAGDARDDARLPPLATVGKAALTRLDALLRAGGAENLARALALAAHLGGLGDDPVLPPVALPSCGAHRFAVPEDGPCGVAALVFYRSHLLAGDIAPLAALADALAARGFGVRALFVGSLKDAPTAAFVAARLAAWRPRVVLNATGFAARRDDGAGSPLDAADAPVLQLLLGGAGRAAWQASARGLGPADLAMQVVLPELDGRLATTAIGFKETAAPDTAPDGLQGVALARHLPDADGIALAADRAAGWARLAAKPAAARRIAVVLSDYPGAGGGQAGHAVGLDTFASLDVILALLREAGYAVAPVDGRRLAAMPPVPFLALDEYARWLADLPAPFVARVAACWGAPGQDGAARDGWFALPFLRAGAIVLALQPDRGARTDRSAGYHDPDTPPCHAYIAFHLWLRRGLDVQALVQLGTHGTLEWLPGKPAAPSAACAPTALLRGLPVIYPFIVNNPGEAAAAKRRLGAVTIGHLTPPLAAAGLHGEAAALERLIDDYAAADGLDRRRTALLRRDIIDHAAACGVLSESGAVGLAEDAALARLDAYLCDVKDLQVRHGLHVFGTPPAPDRRAQMLAANPALDPAALDACAAAERAALLAALDGRLVAPGPAGAPSRGRADVLPTGRNLYAIDPRAVPTRAAVVLAERACADLLRRHLQEHGEWPRTLLLDLWGSATMRTGGEDLALALLLLGARPVWDEGSGRVSGIEVLPLALLDRPRVDVTLRISGLFRDAFPAQIALFDAAVRMVAARGEAPDMNPLAACGEAAPARIYGAAPGDYGAGVGGMLDSGDWRTPADLGAAYLAASAFAYGGGREGVADVAGFAARIAGAAAFLHTQDHRETDVLDGADIAAHAGGFAAAAARLGAAPALYHADTSRPETPSFRPLAEEVARVVRGRAANPRWIASMRPHGYRGAAEIARAGDALFRFAALLPQRLDASFDLLFAATLGDAATDSFLAAANPEARAALRARFADARARGLWHSRRNDLDPVLR